MVKFPVNWVMGNIFFYSGVIFFIFNNMFVITGLPLEIGQIIFIALIGYGALKGTNN